jgi:hypothetical protein
VLATPAVEHRLDLPHCMLVVGTGGQALGCPHVIGPRTEQADTLGATKLDSRQ